MKHLIFWLACLCLPGLALAQHSIKGQVIDQRTGETVIGAQIRTLNTREGTLTDLEGQFTLPYSGPWPVFLSIESAGFRTQQIEVSKEDTLLQVALDIQQEMGKALVVSASRVEERILEAPVSIERLGVLDLRYKPQPRLQDAMSQMPGVMTVSSSLVYQSPNTRGFGNVQNWRFLQLVDGVDVSGPGINYSLGSVLQGSELDVRSIEVVPGPGSALYGANAFNGMMSTRSKSPFDYPGLSAYWRQGAIHTLDGNSQPITDVGVRYAKVFNDQWAVKVNLSYLNGSEWQANDPSFLISNQDIERREELMSRQAHHPNYNAVNVYGDEVTALVHLGDEENPVPVNRSGIPEADLINPAVQSMKVQASLHYRLSPSTEATYDFRYAKSDAVIRHDNFFPFENFEANFHKLELKGDHFFARAYHMTEHSGDAYSLLQAGAIIQEGQKSTQLWGEDYGAAFRGEIPGVSPGNHRAAREFADRDAYLGPIDGTPALLNWTRSIPNDFEGGSAVVYQASLTHAEGNYQFTDEIPWFDLQVGGNLRRYRLLSNGHVYNDGVTGFNEPIWVTEMGTYVQADRRLWQDRLHLRASIRYDKHQEFEGRFSPRGSMVLSLGEQNEHHIRLSGQTGFRNPANQDMYVAFEAGNLVYLGNARSNVANYLYKLTQEETVPGETVYESLVTVDSYEAYETAGSNDPSLLVPADLSYLQQEQITTAELGYRSLWFNRIYVDASVYHNWYHNFTANRLSVSSLDGVPFLTLVNIPEEVRSIGANVGLDLVLPGDFRVGGSYSYSSFDATEAVAANPNYLPDFNFPEHMVKASLGHHDLLYGLGFQLNHRWLSGYLFQTPNGQTPIPDRQITDAAVFYHVRPVKCLVKVGATNLFNLPYTPIYGGPTLGSHYYVQITFDELFR